MMGPSHSWKEAMAALVKYMYILVVTSRSQTPQISMNHQVNASKPVTKVFELKGSCNVACTRVRSKLNVQNSRTFKDPICIFQAPKLSTKSHILDADIHNLDCNVTLKWNQILFPSTGDMHTSACFKIVNKCKNLQDLNSRTFQVPYLFSSTFKGLEVYSKLKHFQGFLKRAVNPVVLLLAVSWRLTLCLGVWQSGAQWLFCYEFFLLFVPFYSRWVVPTCQFLLVQLPLLVALWVFV